MAAGKRLFQFGAKSLTRRSSNGSITMVQSEIRKAEESHKFGLKDFRRQLKQDKELRNRNESPFGTEYRRILLRAAYREIFHVFLIGACAVGTPFGAYYLAKRNKQQSDSRLVSDMLMWDTIRPNK